MAETKFDINKRVQQLRRDTDIEKNISVSIDDIVRTIKDYITNDINPTIVENGQTRKVPVHYANPERWKSIQKNGWMRDPQSNQIMVPVIVFRLSGISKNGNMPVDKLDGNIEITLKTGWDRKYRYDSFNIKNGISPPTNYYTVPVPDYLNFTFDVNVWTGYVSHMNKILEGFIYNEGTYWGDKNKNLFKCNIENYDNTIDVETGQDRAVRNSFTLEVNGYILPEYYKNKPTTIKKLNPYKIVFSFETDKNLTNENLMYVDNKPIITTGNFDNVLNTLSTELNISPSSNTDVFIWDLGEY